MNAACAARLAAALLALALSGCSIRQLAMDELGAAVAEGNAAFAADDDPELIRAAAPFSLKLVESLLTERPDDPRLLLAATRGFTQYAYAFAQQDAEEAEDRDLAGSREAEARARRLYRRARDYGLRGLAAREPRFAAALRESPRAAAARIGGGRVGLLYWTAAAWGGLLALSKGEPALLADLPAFEALLDRALELDEGFGEGAIHTLLIGYEPARPGGTGDPYARSRAHFARAVELSSGAQAAPYVALAEAVSIPRQDRAEFRALLAQALRIDPASAKEHRLANLIVQRRARWLLARTARLFAEQSP